MTRDMHAQVLRISLILAIASATLLTCATIAQRSRAVADFQAERRSTSLGSGDAVDRAAEGEPTPAPSPGDDAFIRRLHETFDHRLRTNHHEILASTGLAPLGMVARVADAARAKTLAYLLGAEVTSRRFGGDVVPIVLCTTDADVDCIKDALATEGRRLPKCLPGLSGLYLRSKRAVLIMPDPHDVAITVAHEVAHSVIREVLPQCASALDEGLAQHIPECLEELRWERERESGGADFWRAVYLIQLLKDRGMPRLTDFVLLKTPMSPASERIQYHALTWCLVKAMRDMDRARGRGELRELFDRLRQGADVVSTIEAVYGCASLSDAWVNIVHEIVEAARSKDPRRKLSER